MELELHNFYAYVWLYVCRMVIKIVNVAIHASRYADRLAGAMLDVHEKCQHQAEVHINEATKMLNDSMVRAGRAREIR